MQKLAIVGLNQRRLDRIRHELKGLNDTLADVRVETVHPNFLEPEIDHNLSLIIFDTNSINKKVFPFIVQLRKFGFKGPMIILGNPSSTFDISELNAIRGVFHLTKSYSEEQLLGLAKNCINVHLLKQRRDQRFSVCEQATLEAYSSDFKRETTICDISRHGVRIEGNLNGLRKGDLLRLQFHFDKINKERIMSARVVWVKKEGDSREEAGLEFVSQKVVYKYLLDYAVA